MYVDHQFGDGRAFLQQLSRFGLAGLIAKQIHSPYRNGPSPAWRAYQTAARGDNHPRGKRQGFARPPQASLQARYSQISLTNLDKLLWPTCRITKRQLIQYYERMASAILPHLRNRPLSLKRYPDGVEQPGFFQKSAVGLVPDWVPTVTVPTRGESVTRILCHDVETLVLLANLAAIELHTGARREGQTSPEWIVFDLAPEAGQFRQTVRIAKLLGKVLRGCGLQPLVKTSGAKGLHLYVPVSPPCTREQVAMFAEAIARIAVHQLPEFATLEHSRRKRNGRTYIDITRNGAGQTVVAPYCVRPVINALVSTPLAWDELEELPDPEAFDIVRLPDRIQQLGDLFRPLLDPQTKLSDAIGQLAGQLADYLT